MKFTSETKRTFTAIKANGMTFGTVDHDLCHVRFAHRDGNINAIAEKVFHSKPRTEWTSHSLVQKVVHALNLSCG